MKTSKATNRIHLHVDITDYVSSHGAEPKGTQYGWWIFENNMGETYERTGTYSTVLQWMDDSQDWTLMP